MSQFLSKKKFSIFLFLGSFLLLSYVFFKSEIVNNGSIRFYYNQYYFLGFLLFFFSVFSFYFNKNIQNNLILFSISLILSLYFLEFLLTKKYFFIKDKDYRDRFQIFNIMKKEKKDIKLSINPSNFYFIKNQKYFPLSGISNKITIHCNESGYYSIYESDNYGFNNPKDEWNKDEIDLLLVGDSFTHGACVNRPFDIASQIRKNHNRTTLNLGYSGNGPLGELATLIEYLPEKKVKNVVWIYFEGNDLTDLMLEMKNPILMKYLKDKDFNQNLSQSQKELDDFIEKFFIERSKSEKRTRFKKFFKLHNIRNFLQPIKFFKGKSITRQPKPPPEFKEILFRAKTLTKKFNANFYFLIFPDYFRYSEINANNNDYKKKEIVEILNDLEIDFLDFHEDIISIKDDPLTFYPFRTNNHFNKLGYQEIANYINTRIRN